MYLHELSFAYITRISKLIKQAHREDQMKIDYFLYKGYIRVILNFFYCESRYIETVQVNLKKKKKD